MADQLDEANIVGNSRLSHLYSHEWQNGAGKYINVILSDDNVIEGFELDISQTKTRVKVTFSFVRDKGEIDAIEIKKFEKRWNSSIWTPSYSGVGEEGIKLRPITLAKLMDVIQLLERLDISAITSRRTPLTVEIGSTLDEGSLRKLRTLLLTDDGTHLVREVLQTENLIAGDIVNVAYRRSQLSEFASMLPDKSLREKDWQDFFRRNPWVFGYGLDYRYMGILQNQPHIGRQELDGTGDVLGDFLLADMRFTAFVEIKTPATQIFSSAASRSRTWRLSTDLFDSVSQILEHKASGQALFEKGDLYDTNGNTIRQEPHDAKVFLIIGSWSEIAGCTEKELDTKKRTFELFRRDSRNIDIMTFDELFERAKFIVERCTDDNQSA